MLEASDDPAAFDAGGVSARCVVADPSGGGGLLMFYEGQSAERRHAIGVATSSDDGCTWERAANGQAVLEPAAETDAWDSIAVSRPWLVPLPDGSARLYYLGRGADGAQAIGVAQSNGADWLTWARISR